MDMDKAVDVDVDVSMGWDGTAGGQARVGGGALRRAAGHLGNASPSSLFLS